MVARNLLYESKNEIINGVVIVIVVFLKKQTG